MQFVPEEGRSRLHVSASNLIGALWFQLARAIDGDVRTSRCVECEKWIEISLTAFRTNRLYCSNGCRSKAYRKRQVEAHELHDRGMTADKIADILETDPETIEAWLAKPPPGLGKGRRGRPRKNK